MNAIKDVMMNKVLAGETGKEKAREWGRWLATNEGQAYLAAQMDADFFEERENMDAVSYTHLTLPTKRIV